MDTKEIEQLRQAAEKAVESASLRGTARDIGMSPVGLSKFIGGTRPQAQTLRALRSWMERQTVEGREREKQTAVDALLRDVREDQREAARDEVLALVRKLEAATPVPPHRKMRKCEWPDCGRSVPVNNYPQHMRRHREGW